MANRLAAILLGLSLAVGVASPVLAQVPTPTAFPTPGPGVLSLPYVTAFRGLTEPTCNYTTNANCDWLIVAEYSIPYATPPSAPANLAYQVRLTNTSGLTIGSNSPIAGAHPAYCPTCSNGFGIGVTSVWLTPAQTTVLTWGDTTLQFRLEGSATVFPSPPTPAIQVPFSYDASGDTASAQADLATAIISLGQTVGAAWGTQLVSSAALQGLNTEGENYFTQAIPGLRAMAPTAFYTQNIQPVATIFPTPTGTPYAYTIANTFPHTSAVGLGLDNLGGLFGWPRGLTAFIVTLILFGIVAGVSVAFLRGDARVGLLIGSPVIYYGAYLGMPMQVIFLLSFAAFALFIKSIFW